MASTLSGTSRTTHAEAILGKELAARLPDTRVLLVGAGGIGCELLKNLVLTGFGQITLVDLDTIDLSNLNRQFLFKKKDVKQSKALHRRQAAFNTNVHLAPIHGNIKEPQFDVAWFKSFDIVLNALDNLDARRHVNKMCLAAGVPLVESGTAGYLGQVQPVLKDRTECFDCIPKETPKTFPVCTIRSTPSQPIHCIVWAKSYLMSQLFGEDEDAGGQSELDAAEKDGENAQEIEKLRLEQRAFKAVRAALRTPADGKGDTAAKMAFEKVFHTDTLNLLSMADMWRAREPPVPLEFDAIRAGTFVLRGATAGAAPSNGASTSTNGKGSSATEKLLNGNGNGHSHVNGDVKPKASATANAAKLKDQRALSLQEVLELFVSSTNRLATRLRAGEETISFDKDDTDALDFVTAAANLRSAAYNIPGKSRWEVKEMAGNIIPAIATTNAIISGLIVLQALHLLRRSYGALRNVYLQFKASLPLGPVGSSAPRAECGVCRDTYAQLLCDPARVTLAEVIEGVLGDGGQHGGTGPREVSVYEDRRVLSDPDWDDNLERTLESLGVTRGKFLTIVDEEGEWGTIALSIGVLPEGHADESAPLILPSPLPLPPRVEKPATPPPATPPPQSLKRSAPDDDEIAEVEAPTAKRARTGALVGNGNGVPYTPSKKRRLDEDGLVLLENKDEELRDDVIEID